MATTDDDRTSDLARFGRRLDLTGEERVGRGALAGASAVLVIDGLVSLETVLGQVRAAQVLGPRDVVALDGDHLPDHFEVLVALLPSRLYVFEGGLDALVTHRPSIGGELLRASMERHRRQAVHRAVVQLPALEDRVLGVLWMLADRFGHVGSEGVVVDLPLTHKLLGRLAGATRSAVTTAFGKLEREGHVRRRDDGSLVIDPASRKVPAVRGGRRGARGMLRAMSTTSDAPVDVPEVGPGRARQSAIYQQGVLGRKPRVPTSFAELERRARRKASVRGWAYVAGGAGEGSTMRANRAAFDRWAIVPRVLRDTSRRDLSVELLGRRTPAPVLFAPVGASELLHPRADVAIAEAAARLGLPYVLSSQSCFSMEECAAAMGDQPRWFQLYWSTDEEVVDSFLRRAEAVDAGAVVVTLDTTMLGWRPQDLDLGSLPFARGEGIAQYVTDPRFRALVRERLAAGAGAARDVEVTLGALRTLLSITRHAPGSFLANLRSKEPRGAVETFLETYSNPALSWRHIEGLRARTKLPILLKGVLHPDDARQARELGVDGLVVSNHGGRQVDGSIASLDALPAIAEAVGDDLTLLLDSGVRSGADVVKALALGADAVLIGRPHVYGLALDGADGAHDAVANIVAELDLTLGLSGLTSIAEVDRDVLARVPA